MMNLKRLGALSLSVVLALSALSGCKSGNDEGQSSSSSQTDASSSSVTQVEPMDLTGVTDPYLAAAGLAGDTVDVENNKKLTKRISKEGHLIGNHTYSHADLARTNYNKASVEINKTNEIITSITGTSPKYIRPPYGDVNKKLLENTGMRVVLWNVDPEDWKDQNADIVVNRIISHVRPGDIILLHDIFKSSVEAALKTVDILQDKGYQFVTVDKLNNSTIK